jgi:hypothetical protein
MLKQCSPKEHGVHIHTGATLLRDHSRVDTDSLSVIGDYLLD